MIIDRYYQNKLYVIKIFNKYVSFGTIHSTISLNSKFTWPQSNQFWFFIPSYLVKPIIVPSYSSANEFVGFPICPGFDVSGEVIYAGSDVTDLRPGDKVFGCTFFGAYSTKVRIIVTHTQSLSCSPHSFMKTQFWIFTNFWLVKSIVFVSFIKIISIDWEFHKNSEFEIRFRESMRWATQCYLFL